MSTSLQQIVRITTLIIFHTPHRKKQQNGQRTPIAYISQSFCLESLAKSFKILQKFFHLRHNDKNNEHRICTLVLTCTQLHIFK